MHIEYSGVSRVVRILIVYEASDVYAHDFRKGWIWIPF